MPIFEVQGPDGKTYEVDAPSIEAAAGAFSTTPSSTPDAMPVEPGGFSDRVNAFTGGVLEGLPVVGPYVKGGVDRLKAGIQSIGNDSRFSDELQAVQARSARTAAENPWTSGAGTLAGGILGTAPMVAAAPAAFGAGTAGLGMRMGASALSGSALGGADAATRSGGDLKAIGSGAGWGAGLGFAGPGIAAGVGRGVGWAADRVQGYLSSADNAVTGISRPAARFASDTVADPVRLSAMNADLQRLGPEAMLADVSPEWMGVARGAASRPGQRDTVVNALLRRDDARNSRLGYDLDAALGPAPTPSLVEASINQARRAAGQEYEAAFAQSRAVDTAPLALKLDALAVDERGAGQVAAREVRQMLNIVGTNELDPNPRTLLATRQAIDGMIAGADGNARRILTQARQAVDEELARSVPGVKDVDAKYAELFRQSEALERGQTIFDSGRGTVVRPNELATEFSSTIAPSGPIVGPSAVPYRMQQGARAEIDRVVGTSANDPAAMQRLLRSEGDWNRDKMRTVFGPEAADRALGAVDRETRFYRTAGRVTSGSDTAMAQRFGDFLDVAAKPNAVPTETTAFGAAVRGGQKLVQSILRTNSEAKAERFAGELGRLAVAQGADRDQAMQIILGILAQRQKPQQIGKGAEAVARALLAPAPLYANQPR